jgi:hypothetical protein
MYKISDETYKIAKELELNIFPSENENKKIDVYKKNGDFLGSIGDSRYNDYHTYLEKEKSGIVPMGTADIRRKAYYKRHYKDIELGGKGYIAFRLLW